MKIIVLGMRRSGTTVFFETLCKDKRFVGFNEPFNPLKTNILDKKWKHYDYNTNFRRLVEQRGPTPFWELFGPIYHFEELQTGLSDKQKDYISFILSSFRHVCTDVTRCHFKIKDMSEIEKKGVFVHLYRPPQSFATSVFLQSEHLLKREKNIIYRKYLIRKEIAKNLVRKKLFFVKYRDKLTHGYGEMTSVFPDSMFAKRLEQADMDYNKILEYPAVGRLLALWKLFYDRAEKDGRKYFGERYLSINFNDFCRNPKKIVAKIYDVLGEEMPKYDFGHVKSPKKAYKEENPEWERYLRELDLPRIS